MISKNRISDVRKLHLKKFRDAQQLFLVEGRKCVEMLLQSDYVVDELFATDLSAESNKLMLANVPITIASPAEMERLSTLSTSPDLLAVVRKQQQFPSLDEHAPVLVLDRIADPGNLGTIIRTADWFGISQVVCSLDCVELFNPKTIQSTMGSFCHVNVRYRDLVEFLSEYGKSHRVLGTFLDGDSVYSFDYQSNDCIVIGSESHGIRPEIHHLITNKITIPRGTSRPSAESLNAGVAAAIVMDRFISNCII